ncbi:MAG: anaerobic glycerol-3-phosphate dehydrogenase subunit B, partial [Chloroflexi bacterium]
MIDVLVIGAGLSGLMTAYKAAKSGLTAKVIAKGLGGALHWSAGTVDLLGYLQKELVNNPQDAFATLGETKPAHPYVQLTSEKVAAYLDEFVALTAEIGLPYVGAAKAGENMLLPSPVGAARPTFFAPQAQVAGDLCRSEPMVIVGFSGLRDFYPKLIAENLNKQGYPARALILPGDLLTDRHESNTIHLANGLADQKRLVQLAKALKPQIKNGERVGFPAVLGMEAHQTVLSTLEKQLKTSVFEIPTLPPSVPGIRLFKALRAKLLSMGVRVEVGMEVIGAEKTAVNGTPGSVSWVESETSSRPMRHRAKQYVLATGGVLGAGFDSDISGRVREVVFDLPLTMPQQRNEWFHASFLHPEGHPVFQGGVAVNDAFQPVNEAGQPLYANLRAVGNVL